MIVKDILRQSQVSPDGRRIRWQRGGLRAEDKQTHMSPRAAERFDGQSVELMPSGAHRLHPSWRCEGADHLDFRGLSAEDIQQVHWECCPRSGVARCAHWDHDVEVPWWAEPIRRLASTPKPHLLPWISTEIPPCRLRILAPTLHGVGRNTLAWHGSTTTLA